MPLLLLLLAAATPAPDPANVLTWPRADPATMGCLLERSFGVHDRKFGCHARKSKPEHDPSKPRYTEGPAFPKAKAAQVGALVAEVKLDWEHGSLQAVTLTLSKPLSEAEARAALHLPDDQHLPPNVVSLSVQECSKAATCVVIQGFDHQGSGD